MSLTKQSSYVSHELIQIKVSKYLFGDTSQETIIEVPQGQLYIVRPLSPKGYSELIFRDAAASVRRTNQPFQYQLVVQRVYEEGEQELLAEGDDDDAVIESLNNAEKDQKIFLLDEGLHFRIEKREGGENVFAWRDLSGDQGDLFEFVCDKSVQRSTVASFQIVAVEAQYERKHRKSAQTATEAELEEFEFADEDPIPSTGSGFLPPREEEENDMANVGVKRSAAATPQKSMAVVQKSPMTVAPPAAKHPAGREQLCSEQAELHMFDFEASSFLLQEEQVHATVFETGNWEYWLQIAGAKRDWLGHAVVDDLNPVFNFEHLSFIFNHYASDGSVYSWLLRFPDQEALERFQHGIMQALWEHKNQMKWAKATDQDYIIEAFQDLEMADAPDEPEEEEEEEDEPAYQRQIEDYDDDEDQDVVETQMKGDGVNSQLAVGYKHDRSFVVRGGAIGVFKHTPDNHLEFQTNIAEVKGPKGKAFNPKKVMLHMEDSNMILQNPNNANSLYRLDLETGKVVDEWKVHDDIPVTNFAPENKYAQMTNEQTLIGMSGNALYRIDPRLAGNKLVDSDLKQYASKNQFSAAATTEKGYIAVASDKGDIRMFDRLGINAKTLIPALGDPIIGVDVSADGRWILATTRTYLLLIDSLQKDGKNAGKLGFEKSFGKDSKPQPRRLALSPAHTAQMAHETKGSKFNFTIAHFNAGVDASETTIVTSTGPFVITWSMKDLLRGTKDPYRIKRYGAEVMADNFRYGTDKNLLVALPNEVDMVRKKELMRPTRESIVGFVPGGSPRTPARGGAKGRASYLRREIVDSPY